MRALWLDIFEVDNGYTVNYRFDDKHEMKNGSFIAEGKDDLKAQMGQVIDSFFSKF